MHQESAELPQLEDKSPSPKFAMENQDESYGVNSQGEKVNAPQIARGSGGISKSQAPPVHIKRMLNPQ